MHVIAYEHLVGFPRESKQHLDAVCMCGRLQRGVQPARSRLCAVHVRRDGIQPATRRSASAPARLAQALRAARPRGARSRDAGTAARATNSLHGK